MKSTNITIPEELYQKLEQEAKYRHTEVADIIELLLKSETPNALRGFDAKLLKDLLALAPRFQGPKDLSTTYKQILYGGKSF